MAWIGIRPLAMSWPPERRAADANGAAHRLSLDQLGNSSVLGSCVNRCGLPPLTLMM